MFIRSIYRLMIAACMIAPASAQMLQSPCKDFEEWTKILSSYGEERAFTGIHGTAGYYQVLFVNATTGTYTWMTVLPATGQGCLVSAGRSGELLPLPVPGRDM